VDGVLRALQSWMDGAGSLPIIWLGLAAVLWLATFAHELGHAAVGLARTKAFVRLQVGREPAWLRFRVGRLLVSLDPRPSTDGEPAGYASVAGRLSAPERAVFAAAGPVAELLFALAIAAVGHPLLSVFLAAVSLVNLVRFRRGRWLSDGRHLLDALRGRGTGQSEEQDTAARAQVLFEAREQHLRPRLDQLAAAASGDPRLLRAAYAGWCWRTAQRLDYRYGGALRDIGRIRQ
jgi:hypothetical protein